MLLYVVRVGVGSLKVQFNASIILNRCIDVVDSTVIKYIMVSNLNLNNR